MTDDDDMVNMMDAMCMDDIGSQHFQWTTDNDLLDDLAYSFILVFEEHNKARADNYTSTMVDDDDDDNDSLFLNKWERQDLDQRMDLDNIITDNPLGLVAIDPNQPSILRPHLISVGQQLRPLLAPTKQKPLKRLPSLSMPRPTASKSQQKKNEGKKPKTNRRLQPKDPNL